MTSRGIPELLNHCGPLGGGAKRDGRGLRTHAQRGMDHWTPGGCGAKLELRLGSVRHANERVVVHLMTDNKTE